MKYLVMLVDYAGVDTPWEQMTAAEQQEFAAGHQRFDEAVKESSSRIIAGEALTGAEGAVVVSNAASGPVVTDGCYAEAIEKIGGFYLMESPSRDELVELVKLLPPYVMEIREVIDDPLP